MVASKENLIVDLESSDSRELLECWFERLNDRTLVNLTDLPKPSFLSEYRSTLEIRPTIYAININPSIRADNLPHPSKN